jgi:hypothetical protein
MSLRRQRRPLALLGAAVILLTGCGGLSDDDVARLAEQFAGGDAGVRCDLLAPATLATLVDEEATACEVAIDDVPLGSGDLMSVAVWGEEAQAKLSDDTLFLTRTSAGWRVMAAACRPQGPDQPYDCQLEGS